LAISISTAFAVTPPKADDYLIGPKNLPPFPSEGGPHDLGLNPTSLSVSTVSGMPVIDFIYDMDHRKAIGIQVFDSRTYAMVNQMQLGGAMARCFQPVSLHPNNEPERKIDGFVGKTAPGCDPGLLFLIDTWKGQPRFLISISNLDGGKIEPGKLRSWLLEAAATLDFKKLQKAPTVE